MATKAFTGGERLKKHLDELAKKVGKGATLNVGFPEGSTEADGTSTPMIAAIQEFGAPSKGIPPRSFFRTMIAKGKDHWGKDLAKILKSLDYDANLSLEQLGVMLENDLRQSIVDLTDPPLSPVTLLLRERFGNNPGEITFADVTKARADIASGVTPKVTGTQAKPLVWTGDMLRNVNHFVEAL